MTSHRCARCGPVSPEHFRDDAPGHVPVAPVRFSRDDVVRLLKKVLWESGRISAEALERDANWYADNYLCHTAVRTTISV